MALSSSLGATGFVGSAVSHDRVEDVDASSGEGEDGLMMGFAFGSFTPVVGLAGLVAADGDEGGLVEDPFERLVARGGAVQVSDLAGLLEDRREACGSGEVVAAG